MPSSCCDGYETASKALSGLDAPEPPQGRHGNDGDPQIAALWQRLAQCSGYSATDAVIDFGSGNGVLATGIAKIWGNKPVPLYVAVDLPGPLDGLSLPVSIHNNSRKIEADEFLKHGIYELSERTRLLVLRNVFHELDIFQTGRLLASINTAIQPKTQIYIQDMETLPRFERGKAGWIPEMLEGMLQEIGMTTSHFELASHSGTKWFVFSAQSSGQKTSEAEAAEICAKWRRKQKSRMVAEVSEKNRDYSADTADDVTILSLEITSLDTQLSNFESAGNVDLQSGTNIMIGSSVVPLSAQNAHHAFNAATDAKIMAEQTGLVGFLRNKGVLDIPALMKSSRKQIWFAGYSQKHTFEFQENINALLEALARKVSVKLLVSDPDCEIVILRSADPVYIDRNSLISDIHYTINGARQFYQQHLSKCPKSIRDNFEIRMTRTIPPSSYFFIDNLCFSSLYLSCLSGSLAPCAIYRATEAGVTGNYEMLRQEFLATFNKGASLLGEPV